jgi:hypothetical protein
MTSGTRTGATTGDATTGGTTGDATTGGTTGDATTGGSTGDATTGATAGATTGGTTGELVLTPVADSYVRSGSDAARNFGTSTSLRVRGDSTVIRSYLRFVVSGLAGRTVSGARLRVTVTDPSVAGVAVARTDGTAWTESGITFSNAPAVGASAGGPVDATTTGAHDVVLSLGALTDGQVVDLVLSSTSGDVTYVASREKATPPNLVLTVS